MTKISAWPIVGIQALLIAYQTITDRSPTAVLLVTAIIVCFLAILVESMRRKLRKHQDALEWFANHVRVDNRAGKDPIPTDLEELLPRD